MEDELIERIQDLMDQEEFREALELIEESEEAFSSDSFFFYLKGYTLFRLEEFESSIEAYRLSIQLDPSSCASYSDLGYVLLVQERWDEAEFFIKKALSLNPSDPLGIERLGLLYYSMGELEEARDCFLLLFQLGKGSPRIHYFLGELHGQLGDYEKSLFYLDQCLEKEPDHFEALFAKAVIFEELGNLKEAIKIFESQVDSVEEEGELLEVLVSLGGCYYKIQDFKKSFEIFKRALQLDDRNPLILNNMGLISMELGYMDAAEGYLGASLRSMDNFEAWFNLGRCHLKCERYRLALSAFRKALRMTGLEHEQGFCYLHLGQIQLELGLLPESLESFERALDLKVESVELYLLYLEASFHASYLKHAYARLEKVRPKELEFYHALFLFTMSQGEFELSLKYINRGLKKFQGHPSLLFYKASIYSMMGNAKQALKNLKASSSADSRFKEAARNNACFQNILHDPEFRRFLEGDSEDIPPVY